MATLNSVTLTTTAEEITADMTRPSATTAEIKPYFEVIKSKIKMYDAYPEQLIDQSYVLYDLDNNGTKELLLGLEGWGITDVYTIQNDIAVRQEEFFVDPYGGAQPVLLKNGTIRKEWVHDGCQLNISYHCFEDGELKFQTSLRDDCDNWGSFFHYNPATKKETPITKAEFNRLQKELEGDGEVVELDWKPLAEYGR